MGAYFAGRPRIHLLGCLSIRQAVAWALCVTYLAALASARPWHGSCVSLKRKTILVHGPLLRQGRQ